MPTYPHHATDRGDMKLILVPSNPNHGPRVSISIPGDFGLIDKVVSDLVVPILIAGGWHPQSVQDALRSVEVPGAVAEDETPPDDLTEWSTPVDLPPLPQVPAGYSGWTAPELSPSEKRPATGLMAFFHASGARGDEDWILSRGGSYGANEFSYPVYFIKAIEA